MTRDYPRASEDLLYEIHMIYLLRGYFAERVLDQALQTRSDHGLPARNAAIESFAIHVRNVIAFLYVARTRSAADDLFADDYVTDFRAYKKARPAKGSTLGSAVVNRIHRQIAHLSHARGGYAPEERVWLYDEICEALDPVVRSFLSYVDPTKVSADFVDEVQHVLDIRRPTKVTVTASGNTTTFQSFGGSATTGMRRPKS
jgi:hypothetical protein